MPHFQTAFQNWSATLPDEKPLKWFAEQADLPVPNTYRIRSGDKPVSHNYLQRLLPVVAREHSEAAALDLLLAYLRDEAGEDWLPKLILATAQPASTNLLDKALAYMRHRADSDADYRKHIITQYLLHQHSDFQTIEELSVEEIGKSYDPANAPPSPAKEAPQSGAAKYAAFASNVLQEEPPAHHYVIQLQSGDSGEKSAQAG